MIQSKIIFIVILLPFFVFSQDLNKSYKIALESFHSKDYEKAIIQFNEAESEEFKSPDLYLKRAICYSILENYSKALNDYNQTLDLAYNSDALYFRALTKADLGQFQDAIDDLNTLLEKDKSYNIALLKIGDFYYKTKKFKQAIKNYELFLETDPDNHYALNQLGYSYGCLDNKKDLIKGIGIISKAIDLDKSNYYYYYCRGYLYYDLNSYKKNNLQNALNDFQTTIELNPNYSSAYFEIGNIYYSKKNYLKQIEFYSKAIDLEKNNGRYYYWRGRGYVEIGLNEMACADFTKAKELKYEVQEIFMKFCDLKGRTIFVTD